MNGNTNHRIYYNESFSDSDRNISQMCNSPECVSANIPAPQLRSSPKPEFHSVLSFWSDMEQGSSRSLPASILKSTLTNGFTRSRLTTIRPDSSTPSDANFLDNSTINKPLSTGLQKTTNTSAPSNHSEESSDIDNISATYEIFVPPKPPKSTKPITVCNKINGQGTIYSEVLRSSNREYTNIPTTTNSQIRLYTTYSEEIPPVLPPKSPLLRPLSRNTERGKYSRNGYQTMPHMNGDRYKVSESRIPNRPLKSSLGTAPTSVVNGIPTNEYLKISTSQSPEKSRGGAALNWTNSTYRDCGVSKVETPIQLQQGTSSSVMQHPVNLFPVRYPTMSMTHSTESAATQGYIPRPHSSLSSPGRYKVESLKHTTLTRGVGSVVSSVFDGSSIKQNGYQNFSPNAHSEWRSIRASNDLKYQHPAEMTSARSPCAAETSASPNCTDENLVVVRIRPNAEGQFGFNVNGGADLNKPVIVTRVGEEMPAGTCFPRLHPGDQVLRINGREISDHTHQQVVNFIRAAAENHSGVLELIVKPSDYLAESATDDHLPETGDAPPRPPKSAMAELKASANESAQAPIWLPTSALGVGGSPKHYLSSPPAPPKVNPKPRLGGSSTLRLKSTSGSGPKKILVSDTERLHHSIQAIENGLADGSLIRQFELLERRKLTATMLDAKSYENLPKNRYRDISPYDQTRVRIEGVTGDYINASFVKMSIPKANLQKEYIAAQGPLPNTCLDFWQMCWEQKSELIVMLTSVQEQGRFKCHKYWPDPKNTFEYTWNQPKSSIKASPTSGKRFQLRISNIKEEPRKDIFYREFQLQRTVSTANSFSTHNSPPSTYHLRVIPFTGDKTSSPEAGEIRRVVQLQYVTWPDHGVPGDCGDLIEFVEQMRQLRGEINSVPAVVHCSAGIGRTGVVILLDTAVDMIRAGSPVDPLEMVHQMRNYREMLIQTPAQFEFACEAIVKYYSDTVRKRLQMKNR
uniref:Protein-tyrosine-phosphatase n=1 Tax=Mesocestoides corti TaxID=53468 RepID=A0A5K3ELN1_MESCO